MSQKDSSKESKASKGQTRLEQWYETYGTGPALTPLEMQRRANARLAELGVPPLDPRHCVPDPEMDPDPETDPQPDTDPGPEPTPEPE